MFLPNLAPERALVSDTNVHIISLYKGIQKKSITPKIVREYSVEAGKNSHQKERVFIIKLEQDLIKNTTPSILGLL